MLRKKEAGNRSTQFCLLPQPGKKATIGGKISTLSGINLQLVSKANQDTFYLTKQIK